MGNTKDSLSFALLHSSIISFGKHFKSVPRVMINNFGGEQKIIILWETLKTIYLLLSSTVVK